MKTKRVALVTSRKWNIPARCDRILADALRKEGIHVDIVSWEDPHPWMSYDLLILRSCWDYHLHYDEFCRWLSELKTMGAPLANGIPMIESNIDKVRQMQLLRRGTVPIIPSTVCSSVEEACVVFQNEYRGTAVVKPSISASGYHTALVYDPDTLTRAAQLIVHDGNKIIMQPFIDTVCDGEISMIFFHGMFSHAVRRFPGITAARHAPVPVDTLAPEWFEAANAVCCAFSAENLLYARIDMVSYCGAIHIMEVELAEPELYLDLDYVSEYRPLERFVKHIRQEIERSDSTG